MERWKKLSLFAVAGAVAGYAYYYYIGCYNGSCVIGSNPYISSAYGSLLGLSLGWGKKERKRGGEE